MSLFGGAGHDTLAGNQGNDELFGGEGSDGYVYESGDGNDIIIDAPGAEDQDVIVFAGHYRPEDVSFFRDPAAMDDLILRLSGGGSITVRDHFNGSAIDTIEFSTGTVWTSVDVQDRASAATISANDIPDARPDSYIYAGTGDFTINSAALLENDSDNDGDTLAIVSVTDVSLGNVTVDSGGNIFVSSVGTASAINFRYWIADGRGGTSSALAEIALFPNQPPQITSAELAPAIEDLDSAGRVFASDPDGDSLVYRIKVGSGPQRGIVIFGENGNFIYRPNANANGADAFTIVVTDALTGTAEYNFIPVIAASNDNPIALADLLGIVQGGSTKTIASSDLLGNDSDIDGDQLHVSSVLGAVGGTVSLAENGEIRFAATSGYAGAGSFAYTITDSQGGTAQATASLTIIENTAVNQHLFVGTNRDDKLTGTDEADVFIGKRGNDVLDGRGGNDIFEVRGQAGLDIYKGGAGYDTIRGGAGVDVIRVTSNQSNLNSIERIDGGGSRYNSINATGKNDKLDFSHIAITGIERIKLGAGNDTILGSKGNDTFIGGAGQDTFKFKSGHGHDVVLDFESGFIGRGSDKIDLRETNINSYLELIENLHQVGTNTVITLSQDSNITLKHTAPWQLSFDNFLL